jgi:hypothetical protein
VRAGVSQGVSVTGNTHLVLCAMKDRCRQSPLLSLQASGKAEENQRADGSVDDLFAQSASASGALPQLR